MDFFVGPSEFMTLASTLLLLLMSNNRAIDFSQTPSDEDMENSLEIVTAPLQEPLLEFLTMAQASLHSFRLCHVFSLLEDDLGYWVKPRSTTWFSRFLLNQYDNERWVTMFRMTKPAVYSLAEILKLRIQRKDTNEMFAIGKTIVSLVLREVVEAINISLRSEISWPSGQKLLDIEAGFQHLSGLPGVVRAINGTHISICKPRNGPTDYFYFKSGGYSLNCQAVVDSNKRFLDLFLGMPGSTNNLRVLRRSSLYPKGMHGILWDPTVSFNGFSPYLLADSGYPLLPWLMVPCRGQANLSIANTLFNKKLRRGHGVVENAFGILKQIFRELLVKFGLQVTFLPDVITCCAILHNMLLGQSHEHVERLFQVLRTEGFNEQNGEDLAVPIEVGDVVRDDCAFAEGTEKHRQLGVFLAVQQNITL